MFPEIDGIKGESKDKTHAKQIDALSWSWGMSNNGSAHVGGDPGPGRSMCRTSGSSSTRLEEVCGPEVALELASAPRALLSPGALSAQRYRLPEDLGDSPQGRRFLAEDVQQQRQVSLTPVAALGEEGNAVLQRALADECSSGDELAQQLVAAAGEAEPVALASRDSATGGSQEADPQSAPADSLKKHPFWEDRVPRRALAVGLVVLVGLGGYAWSRANRRPHPATEARFRLTAAPGASSSAPSAAGSATPEWDTASPMAISDPQPVPHSKEGEEDGATLEQPAPSRVQTDPPTPIGSAALAPSAALAKADLTLPPPDPSSVPLPQETPVETTFPSEGGTVITPRAFTVTTLGARVRWRHVDRPRPPARPSFWQWLFGHKETKKAKPGKPRY